MDLDKLHTSVKKLDDHLSDRHTGTTSWWIMLGNLVREIDDAVFGNIEKILEVDDED